MRILFKTIAVATMGIALVGCSTKQDTGVLVGGAAGALLGSQFGQGSGQALATVGGALVGALVGGQIGKYMDKTDKLEMNQALEKNATNRSKSWTNPDSGNQYTVTPKRTYYKNSQPCREYTTEAIIGGKKESVYGKACRQADGSWKVAK